MNNNPPTSRDSGICSSSARAERLVFGGGPDPVAKAKSILHVSKKFFSELLLFPFFTVNRLIPAFPVTRLLHVLFLIKRQLLHPIKQSLFFFIEK
ncbi:hypothetical protein XELAEV_18030151mg [Xenopus laevis]|uniref:Uncharacterized protein n=1 Tax=Xenopus laevis TaxID=8355 RepID=A0A974CUM9_XENLA|nr:hypothetical protein XELAEV_18030151mg [Xenopus laevis]